MTTQTNNSYDNPAAEQEIEDESLDKGSFKVIAASSVASVFEWFDFFLYGAMAVVISRNFFSGVDESTAFVLALLAFASGFAVRPFGAIVFGFLGDLWGRKNTFIITLLLMGASTFAVGLLPTYEQAGALAPWALVLLRMLQGLSVGGVYGGAAVYVAEHVPSTRRGFFTSWIQITATLGMALSLAVLYGTRTIVGEEAFVEWGWRVPFLLSIFLLSVTIWIQMRLAESPVYLKMKSSGRSSSRPWADAFGNWKNVRLILISLFGAVIGMAVIWYTAQFYVLFFMERILKVDPALTNLMVASALLISTPLYVFFGWLSDKIGRRPIVLAACLLAAGTYFPIFKALTAAANPALAQAMATSPVTVEADRSQCSFQFDPVGKRTFTSSCDIILQYLARAGVAYEVVDGPAGVNAELKAGSTSLASFDGGALPKQLLKEQRTAWEKKAASILANAGYPVSAEREKINIPKVMVILVFLMSFAAMIYGPIAATLTELFPAKVRYTSMSLPYHLGTGWVGGFLPPVAFAMVAATGNIYSGLWYPLGFAAMTFVIGFFLLPETKGKNLRD